MVLPLHSFIHAVVFWSLVRVLTLRVLFASIDHLTCGGAFGCYLNSSVATFVSTGGLVSVILPVP
jgi:hypothetical protein